MRQIEANLVSAKLKRERESTRTLAAGVVKMAAKHERECLEIIDQRDKAEEAMSQAYYIVTGRSPEWSNKFGYDEALEEIGDVVSVLKQAVKANQSKR